MRRIFLLFFFLCFSSLIPSSIFAQWMQSNGPYGGIVECLAGGNTKVFAGTFNGIFGTSDQGSNWSRISTGLTQNQVSSIVAAIDGTIIASTQGNGIFFSNNSGLSWSQSSGLASGYVSHLIASTSGKYFALASNVYKSTDKGASWQLSGGSSSPICDAICADSSGNIYAANFGKFLLSTDEGETWSAQLPGLPRRYCNSLAANKAGILFAATDSLAWRSTDQGKNWTPLNVGHTQYPVLVFSTAQNKIYGAATWEFYQSSDNGTSWSSATFKGGQPSGILALSPTDFLISTYGGVVRSIDGGVSWSAAVNGLTSTSIGHLVAKSSGDVFAAVAAHLAGVFHSADNGKTWIDANLRTESYAPVASLALLHHGAVLAGTYGSGLFRTSNNAASWTAVGNLSDSSILSLAVTAEDGILAGTSRQGVFFSSDSGDHWLKISPSISDVNIKAIAIDSSGNFIIGAAQGNVFRSTDQGSHWTNIAGSIVKGYLNSIAVNKAGTIFLSAFTQGLLKTLDNGAHWDHLTTGLPDSNITSLTLDGDTLYATFSDSGIYRSTNEGQNWQPMNFGLADRNVTSVAMSPNGYFFAGTFGDGVYRSGTLKAEVSEMLHSEYDLASTYPNPAFGMVHITFNTQKSAHAALKIINFLGEQVDAIDLGELTAGYNEIHFDSSKLPNGLYSYIIICGSHRIAGEIIVMH